MENMEQMRWRRLGVEEGEKVNRKNEKMRKREEGKGRKSPGDLIGADDEIQTQEAK